MSDVILIEIEVSLPDNLSEEASMEIVKGEIRDVIVGTRAAPLPGARILSVRKLDPGETWQVVRVVPAAAEEERVKREVVGDLVPLRRGQKRRAEREILYLLGPLAEGSQMTSVGFCNGTNTLIANVQLASCPVAIPFVFELLPETTQRILGK